jgi:hypothetical protein
VKRAARAISSIFIAIKLKKMNNIELINGSWFQLKKYPQLFFDGKVYRALYATQEKVIAVEKDKSDDSTGYSFELKNIEGVQITPDVLERFEFELQRTIDNIEVYCHKDLPGQYKLVCKHKWMGDDEYYIAVVNELSFEPVNKKGSIKFVHELQGAMYFLTKNQLQ